MRILRFISLYFAISLIVIIPGLLSLLFNGLRPGLDFTGGSLLELQFTQTVSADQVSSALGDVYPVGSIIGTDRNSLIIRGEMLENERKIALVSQLTQKLGEVKVVRFESIGPTLGRELLLKTLAAVALVATIITLYVWKQFKEPQFGVSAILAMLHDSLVLLGSFSLFGFFWKVEVDVLFVTALLTTLSFSVHDTIVVFDRIRELRRRMGSVSLEEIANAAVVETLGRSLNNSLTIILMLVSLVVLGGESIRWFAVALLIGAISGTYSSTFTAVPLLLVWERLRRRKK